MENIKRKMGVKALELTENEHEQLQMIVKKAVTGGSAIELAYVNVRIGYTKTNGCVKHPFLVRNYRSVCLNQAKTRVNDALRSYR